MHFLTIISMLLATAVFKPTVCQNAECDINAESECKNPEYENCLKIAARGERQKCIALLAYKHIEYPSAYRIIKGELAAPWFSSNIIGRITPTGIFPDEIQSIDYFYGIASTSAIIMNEISGEEDPGVVPFMSYPHYITSEDDIVSGRFDYTMGNYPINDCTMNFTLSGFNRFNENGTKIIRYDLTLQRWGLAVEQINKCRGTDPLDIDFICGVERMKCKDDYQQYDHSLGVLKRNNPRDLPKCKEFLSTLQRGTWDHVISNTITCRVLHSFLAVVRPEVHCMHIGVSGGEACKDYDYGFYYQNIY